MLTSETRLFTIANLYISFRSTCSSVSLCSYDELSVHLYVFQVSYKTWYYLVQVV